MRILIAANNDIGLYKFRRELIEELVKNNEVFFCVPNGDFVEKIKPLGAKFISCDLLDRRGTNPLKDFSLFAFYHRTLKQLQPDVVLTYTIKPNIYCGLACQKRKIPYMSNITGLGTSMENGGLLFTVSKMLYKTGLRKAHCVFFQNSNNRDFFIKNSIYVGKTRLISGSGVNLDNFQYEPYPANDQGIRFLYVGRLMKEKGIDELFQAIQTIYSENDTVSLDVVGEYEEDYSKDIKMLTDMGLLLYHGLQKDVHPFYKNCHCVVLPSYHEGTSNVLLEASASGRPVIATFVPGCQETFDDGVTGYGCEAKSTESIITAMRKFLSLSQEEKEKMGIAAREKMIKEYDRKKVIQAYKEELAAISFESKK